MPLFTASVLTTLGLSVISGAIKCAGGGSLGEAMLGTVDGIFGEVLGGVCGDQFNQFWDGIQASPDIKQNADVERCSIDALLRALITFSEAAKQHVPTTELTQQDKKDCLFFLTEAQKHFNKRLAKLGELPDTDPVLNQNPLTQGDALARVLAKDQTERIAAMKVELTDYALQEFNYQPENKLYQQLAVWLPQGLPGGQHWFVYYIHALHANLKKDNPQYCKDARRILTQQQLADISLITQASLTQLDGLMTRTAEMHALMATVYDVVLDTHSVVVGMKEQMDRLERHSVQNPDPTVFPQYDEYQRQLAEKDKAFASVQHDLEKWQPRLAQADELAAELLQEKIAALANQGLTIDRERQQIRDNLADFERSVQALAQLLSPDDPEKDSALLRQARERYEAGDFSGANEVLSEANIDGMIARAEAKRQEANLIDQKAAQAYLAKANALAGAKPDPNWLNEAIRFCKRAVEIYANKDTFFAAAYFLQTYNQFADAIGLYQRVLSVELAFEEKASTLNNLANLLEEYPDEHSLAKQYYEEALSIRRQLALGTPGAYLLNVAMTLNNLAILLAKYPDEHSLAKQYYEEALVVYRQLALGTPGAYLPNVAMTLNNLAILLAKYPDEHSLAKQYYEEALSIRRQLALGTPGAYLPDVATTLNNLAILLAKYPDEHSLAKQYYEEALSIRRQLALGTPGAYLPDVATTLNNLANLLAKYPDEHSLAKQYYEEALSIRRQLALGTPGAYLPNVATTLNNLAILLAKYPDEHSLAKQYYEEALVVYRQLALGTPGAYLPDVAMTLNNLANLLAGYPDEHSLAKQYYEEALVVYRQLALGTPGAYLPDVATTLNNLAILLAKYPDEHSLAKQYYEEALVVYRQLALGTPGAYLPDVAMTLNNLANLLAGYPDEHSLAKQYYEEALVVYRQLALGTPGAYLPDVATTLNNLAILLAKYPDEHSLAKQYYEEALSIRRQLALGTPGAYTLDLAQTLVGFSIFYVVSVPDKEQSMALAREANGLLKSFLAVPLARSLAEACQQIATHWGEEL